MARITLTINLEKRRWTEPAVAVLAYACALVSLISERLASRVADRATGLIARHGFRYIVD